MATKKPAALEIEPMTIRFNALTYLDQLIEDGVAFGVQRWMRKGNCPRGMKEEHAASLREHVEREVSSAIFGAMEIPE